MFRSVGVRLAAAQCARFCRIPAAPAPSVRETHLPLSFSLCPCVARWVGRAGWLAGWLAGWPVSALCCRPGRTYHPCTARTRRRARGAARARGGEPRTIKSHARASHSSRAARTHASARSELETTSSVISCQNAYAYVRRIRVFTVLRAAFPERARARGSSRGSAGRPAAPRCPRACGAEMPSRARERRRRGTQRREARSAARQREAFS